MKNILVIDDDIRIGDLIEEVLTGEGYGVWRAYSGSEALLLLEKKKPDLVLLDLMLPGLPGEEILPRIKDTPTIIVSAKVGVEDKVSLLLEGAADYITKPFNTRELAARVAVALRKQNQTASDVLHFADLTLDAQTHLVTAETDDGDMEKKIALTKTEYAILKLLMQNPDQVIAKSVILDRIAEDTPDCTESSLKTHISHLRGKLREATGKEYIEAVWGIGFRLTEE